MIKARLFWLGLILICAAGCAHRPVPTTPPVSAPSISTSTNAALVIAAPAAAPASIPRPLPTIFIAGDSTAARGAGTNQQGWGVPFAQYFDPEKVNLVNGARGGRSSRTFVAEGTWDRLVAQVKSNDIVLIQFGVNDGGPINETPARGSLRGFGDETQEIDNVVTKQHEIVHTYGWYLRKMIDDTKAKGATPIVLTTTVRAIWKDGKIERGPGRMPEWASETAKRARVPCVDVSNIAADQLEPMGESEVKALYPKDHTHFNAVGADIHAAAVVSGLKGLRPSPIGRFLSDKGRAVKTDPVSWLYLPRPGDVALPTVFLIGDSTVRQGRGDGSEGGQWGWGEYFDDYFDPTKINVVNRAVGGTTSRTYRREGYWDRVLAMMKPGDFVMMQFGHNDNGNPATGKTSIKGVGDQTIDVENPTNHEHEIVHTFGWYIEQYVKDARAKGATPIVCSLIPRFREGKPIRSTDTHALWAKQAAEAENAPFVNLNEIIATHYDQLGPEKVAPMFYDALHTKAKGAAYNAQCVVEGLKALNEDPLEPFFRADVPQPVVP
jgi:lysophospholipase L1-like esterase